MSNGREDRSITISPQQIVEEARKWIGSPSHRYQGPDAGQTPEWFDCSGFPRFVLRQIGFPVPDHIRHCNEFFDQFGVLVHNYQPGDFIFFSKNGLSPTHMGIVTEETTYIHAPGKNNSVVRENTWKEKTINGNTEIVLYLRDPIGFKRIAMKEGRWYAIQ